MNKVGEIIRKKREEKGMLLRQLAAFVDIDQAIVSKIERGERKARKEQILKIAEVLELNENKLLIEYYSDNIAYEIVNENIAKEVLRAAEKKVEYLKKNE
jgi:transcriptional regulator with XRE-family HTH domain